MTDSKADKEPADRETDKARDSKDADRDAANTQEGAKLDRESQGIQGTQTGITGDAYLSGLINVNIQNLNLQAQDLIDVNDVLNNNQIPVLLQALTSNSEANQNAERLTDQLQEDGLIEETDRVVGIVPDELPTGGRNGERVALRDNGSRDTASRNGDRGRASSKSGAKETHDDRAAKTGRGSRRNPDAGKVLTMPEREFDRLVRDLPADAGNGGGQPGGGQAGGGQAGGAGGQQEAEPAEESRPAEPNAETLLDGLINVNLEDININIEDVVDVQDVLNDNQIEVLVQALNNQTEAEQNAQRLTGMLQNDKMLERGERVVGFHDGQVFTMPE